MKPSMTDRKVALVTGGAKRVGKAIVQRLSAEGFDVAFTYRSSQTEALDLEKKIREIPDRDALAIDVDLADSEAAGERVGNAVEERFGRLDVLVNSASVFLPGRLRDTDLAMARKVAAVHVQTPLMLCKRFESTLRKRRGHIINMVDLLAEKPWPEYLIYCASKAALANLTLGLARELAPEVTVNGVAPGVVDWPNDYPQSERDRYLARVPLARAGTPTDVANLVHFLCTSGTYINGQIIRLDGGRSIT